VGVPDTGVVHRHVHGGSCGLSYQLQFRNSSQEGGRGTACVTWSSPTVFLHRIPKEPQTEVRATNIRYGALDMLPAIASPPWHGMVWPGMVWWNAPERSGQALRNAYCRLFPCRLFPRRRCKGEVGEARNKTKTILHLTMPLCALVRQNKITDPPLDDTRRQGVGKPLYTHAGGWGSRYGKIPKLPPRHLFQR